MKRQHHQALLARKRGSLSVELTCGSVMAAVFVVIALHLGIIVFGAYINDRVCRDACRQAAQGQDLAESTKLASAVIKSYPGGTFLSQPKLDGAVVYQDFGGSPPAQTSPYVQVRTKTEAIMPFGPLAFFNAGVLQDGKVAFVKSYTFPIVRVK